MSYTSSILRDIYFISFVMPTNHQITLDGRLSNNIIQSFHLTNFVEKQ